MMEMFDMGKYAGYVWVSYAITGIVLLLSYIVPQQRHKKQLRVLKRKLRADRLTS